jgi:hypothetical protein
VAKDYTREQATANRLIAKFGGGATLIRKGQTDPSNPFAPAGADVSYPVTIVDVGNNSLTRRADSLSLAWAKAGYMATPEAVTPLPTDVLTISGRNYTLLETKPLTPNPDGVTVMFEWMASE